MQNTYTPTQQPVSSYGLFKQIYLSWMKDYGQYICSKGNDQFNEDLFDLMVCSDRKFDVENPYQLMQFISYQNIKIKELFRKYYYNDPSVRNQYSIVSDTELLIQQLQKNQYNTDTDTEMIVNQVTSINAFTEAINKKIQDM